MTEDGKQGFYTWGQPISSWDEVRAEIEGLAREPEQRRKDDQAGAVSEVEEPEEASQVNGQLRPLVEEGRRVMVCVRHAKTKTRHGPKEYLYWRDENSGLVLEQFFPHYEKYPIGSKTVRNYLAAMGVRPKRLDRVSLKKLVGIRAEVFVETVKPEYAVGALKGQPMPETLSYSKVSEILEPLGRVDLTTLN